MKKFNSYLAIAAVALTSVFGFTSCDKADEPFDTPTSQPGGNRVIDNPGDKGDTNNNGDKGNNDGTNNNGGTTTVDTSSDVKAVTAKDLAGTYKYTDENGKEWTIEMTENSGNGANYYYAMITVPEGYGVDAKTYDGQYLIGYRMATFHTYDKTGDKYSNSIASFGFEFNKDNLKNATVYLKLKGVDFGIVEFVKQ